MDGHQEWHAASKHITPAISKGLLADLSGRPPTVLDKP